MEAQVKCKLCGGSPAGDPEFSIKHFQHRELEKTGRARGPMVYICPRCSGRTRVEADKELKGKA
ncbi:MAG TPA: hypothetical protein VNT75_05820 [Symbiobacteriaceae bacterium]|nr:hypothetical protein [Symbiobacteriaceae bacterium]